MRVAGIPSAEMPVAAAYAFLQESRRWAFPSDTHIHHFTRRVHVWKIDCRASRPLSARDPSLEAILQTDWRKPGRMEKEGAGRGSAALPGGDGSISIETGGDCCQQLQKIISTFASWLHAEVNNVAWGGDSTFPFHSSFCLLNIFRPSHLVRPACSNLIGHLRSQVH